MQKVGKRFFKLPKLNCILLTRVTARVSCSPGLIFSFSLDRYMLVDIINTIKTSWRLERVLKLNKLFENV